MFFLCQAAPSGPEAKAKSKSSASKPEAKSPAVKKKVLPPPPVKEKAKAKPKASLKRPAAAVESDTGSQMKRPAAANLKSEPVDPATKKKPAAHTTPSGQPGHDLKSMFEIMIYLFWNLSHGFPEANGKSQAYIITKRRVSVRWKLMAVKSSRHLPWRRTILRNVYSCFAV